MSRPLTRSERERMQAHQKVEEELRAKRLEEREETKAIAAWLTESQWKLHYNILGTPLSLAYKWENDKATIYFTTMSEEDTFSRPAARAALRKHIMEQTHRLGFRLSRLGGRHSTQDWAIFISLLSARLLERMETHPQEFPRKYVREALRVRDYDSVTATTARRVLQNLSDLGIH